MGANERHLFTSESVTEGHPDKVSDQVSDAVLDAILAIDPTGRVACETLVTTGLCMLRPRARRSRISATPTRRWASPTTPARSSPRSTSSRGTSPWAWTPGAPVTRA